MIRFVIIMTRRLAALVLVFVFASSLVDVPVLFAQTGDSKRACCCKGKVCRCEHGMKMKHCALKKNAPSHAHPKRYQVPSGYLVPFALLPLDCGNSEDKAISAANSKEFYFRTFSSFDPCVPEVFVLDARQNYFSIPPKILDRPPAITPVV